PIAQCSFTLRNSIEELTSRQRRLESRVLEAFSAGSLIRCRSFQRVVIWSFTKSRSKPCRSRSASSGFMCFYHVFPRGTLNRRQRVQIEITCRHGSISQDFHDYINRKTEKLLTFFERVTSIQVTLDYEG